MGYDINNMTLEELDQAIYDIYMWWYKEKPGVHPQEYGDLAFLWRRFDYLVELEA